MKRPITLRKIEQFLTVTGWGPSRLGRAAVGDAHLVRDLRNGRAMTEKTEAEVARVMQAHITATRETARKLGALAR